jgi:hypothetical protein
MTCDRSATPCSGRETANLPESCCLGVSVTRPAASTVFIASPDVCWRPVHHSRCATSTLLLLALPYSRTARLRVPLQTLYHLFIGSSLFGPSWLRAARNRCSREERGCSGEGAEGPWAEARRVLGRWRGGSSSGGAEGPRTKAWWVLGRGAEDTQQ